MICPDGLTLEMNPNETILDACLRNGVNLEHACEKACACTTCHVIVKEGFDSLENAGDDEEDQLDKAWGLETNSRLSCVCKVYKDMTCMKNS